MPYKTGDDKPKTAGEVRRLIADKELNWTVDARLRDNDQAPAYPRGGQDRRDSEPNEPPIELSHYLREHAPTNPFLRARWVELRLLSRAHRGPTLGSPPIIPGHDHDKGVER